VFAPSPTKTTSPACLIRDVSHYTGGTKQSKCSISENDVSTSVSEESMPSESIGRCSGEVTTGPAPAAEVHVV
jgi:hypothetical protein